MIILKRQIVLSAAVLIGVALLFACTKTEKRRTKSVDVSNVKMITTDMSRPRVRIGLHGVPEVLPLMAAVLRMEIYDGEKRYVLPAESFVSDSAAGAAWLFGPWLNSPAGGELSIGIAWVDSAGRETEVGKVGLALGGNWFYDVNIMASAGDFCGSCEGCDGCEDYPIPAPLAGEGRDRLAAYWTRGVLSPPTE